MVNTIFNKDCIEGLKELPDASVNCCVTSPPYFGLRDYGNDGQIGLEATPDEYVAKMVDVFRGVKRVLKDSGTLWLNLGDSYGAYGGDTYHGFNERYHGNGGGNSKQNNTLNGIKEIKLETGLRPKNLLGIPWRVAFALQANGWYLRQDIIWHKPNPMPESVTDRCTKAHEYIFLLSKSQRYYYDYEAIRYPMLEASIQRNQSGWNGNEDRSWVSGKQNNMSKYLGSAKAKEAEYANKRSVWTVTTKAFKEAHFATFPEDLIVDCIKAGCPEGGIVLDPFMGAGTTALVSRKLNRNYVGFELNPDYIKIAEKRLHNEIGLFI